MSEYLIALDQGTTSTRAMAFSREGGVLDVHQIEFKQHYPKPGCQGRDYRRLTAVSSR